MMAATGCDGVVVGRGCLGRPWLFAELVDAFAGPAPAGAAARSATCVDGAAAPRRAARRRRRRAQRHALDAPPQPAGTCRATPSAARSRRRLGLVETLAELDGDPRRARPRRCVQEPGATALPRGHTDGPRPVTPARGLARPRRRPDAAGRRRAARQRRVVGTASRSLAYASARRPWPGRDRSSGSNGLRQKSSEPASMALVLDAGLSPRRPRRRRRRRRRAPDLAHGGEAVLASASSRRSRRRRGASRSAMATASSPSAASGRPSRRLEHADDEPADARVVLGHEGPEQALAFGATSRTARVTIGAAPVEK